MVETKIFPLVLELCELSLIFVSLLENKEANGLFFITIFYFLLSYQTHWPFYLCTNVTKNPEPIPAELRLLPAIRIPDIRKMDGHIKGRRVHHRQSRDPSLSLIETMCWDVRGHCNEPRLCSGDVYNLILPPH